MTPSLSSVDSTGFPLTLALTLGDPEEEVAEAVLGSCTEPPSLMAAAVVTAFLILPCKGAHKRELQSTPFGKWPEDEVSVIRARGTHGHSPLL